MAEGYAREKWIWTEEDFERMGWYDALVHALSFQPDAWGFLLDLDYILEWKKTWATGEKRDAIATAIRSLVLLGWVRLRLSESLPEAA